MVGMGVRVGVRGVTVDVGVGAREVAAAVASRAQPAMSKEKVSATPNSARLSTARHCTGSRSAAQDAKAPLPCRGGALWSRTGVLLPQVDTVAESWWE
jgi:hypothetical protein